MAQYLYDSPIPYEDDNGWGPDDYSSSGINFVVANNWEAVLDGSITSTSTSATITVDAAMENMPDYHRLIITVYTDNGGEEEDMEIMAIRSMTGTGTTRTIGLVRGLEGTTPIAHGNNSKVEARLTSGLYSHAHNRRPLYLEWITTGTKLIGPTNGAPVFVRVDSDNVTLDFQGSPSAYVQSGYRTLNIIPIVVATMVDFTGTLTWANTYGSPMAWAEGAPPTLEPGETIVVLAVWTGDAGWALIKSGLIFQ